MTPYHPTTEHRKNRMMPPPGFNGYVRISPGKFGRTIETRKQDANGGYVSTTKNEVINRSATVYHELTESWYRTTKNLYYNYGSPAAHQSAVNDEGSTYGHSQPISTFKHD